MMKTLNRGSMANILKTVVCFQLLFSFGFCATVEPEITTTITTEPVYVSPLDPPISPPDYTDAPSTTDPLSDLPFSIPDTPGDTDTPELTTSTSTSTSTTITSPSSTDCPEPQATLCRSSLLRCKSGTGVDPVLIGSSSQTCNVKCQEDGFRRGQCLLSPNSICPCDLIISHCTCSN